MRRVRFRYLEGDEDADNYQGHSHARIYVEETAPRVPILYSWLLFVAGLMCGANLEPQQILMALVISGFALGALIQLLEVRSSSRNRS